MHATMRRKVQAAKRKESVMQALAGIRTPEARKARIKMVEGRHWFDREPKGKLLTGYRPG